MGRSVQRQRRCSVVWGLLLAPLSGGTLVAQESTSGTCNVPAPDPVVHVQLPGKPSTPVVTGDGCWVFVALTAEEPGLAVVSRRNGVLHLERTIPHPTDRWGPTGVVLTHDERTLIAAAGDSIAFFDVERLVNGQGDPVLGFLQVGAGAGAVYVNVTGDDRTLFVALERAAAILVVDLEGLRDGGGFHEPQPIGRVPVGLSPIAVTLSSDERYLFNTSQLADFAWGWDIECRSETNPGAEPRFPRGAVVVVDVSRARSDPANAVVTRTPVGCNPVRLILAPDGRTAWISMRGDHRIVAVDTRRLIEDPAGAILGRVPVGTSPVGVAVLDAGGRVVVANSSRFGGDQADVPSLSIVDVADGPSAATVVGSVSTGGFPREVRLTSDGRTLLVTNYGSRTLQVIDLDRLDHIVR